MMMEQTSASIAATTATTSAVRGLGIAHLLNPTTGTLRSTVATHAAISAGVAHRVHLLTVLGHAFTRRLVWALNHAPLRSLLHGALSHSLLGRLLHRCLCHALLGSLVRH